MDYYHHLIDALLEAGIKPAITLYHWDLPQALQEQGGWSHRDTANFFGDYAKTCYEELGDRVDFWMTINEPPCIVWSGYEAGFDAPGISDGKAAFRAGHHVNLAHGLAVEEFRASGRQGQIGIVMNFPPTRPATLREEDVYAADRARDKVGRFFLDPIYGRGYPSRLLEAYPDRQIPVKEGDLEIISQPTDFLGINNYCESVVAYDPDHPEKFKYVPTYYPKTEMGWDIVPDGMYRLLKWIDQEYDHPVIYVTENGCAMNDTLGEDGKCHDRGRVEYLRAYIAACGKALAQGVDLRGYFQWSYIDNFEWTHGYTKRFGIVYCDYVNQRRVPKDSFYFYRDVIAGYAEI